MDGAEDLEEKTPVQKRLFKNQGSYLNLNPIYAPK